LNVSYNTVGVRLATARLEPTTVRISGTFSLEKRAGLLTEDVLTGLKNAEEFYYIVLKSPSVNVALTTTGSSLDANVRRPARSIGGCVVTGDISPNVRVRALPAITYPAITCSFTGIRLVLGNAPGVSPVSGSVSELVFKHSYGAVNVDITGNTAAEVMYTSQAGIISSGGFCIGERVHVSNPAVGSASLVISAEDTRLAIRGEVVDTWNTTTNTGNDDFRLAVRYDETSYWTTLEDSGNDYRLAVRLESHETLPTSGTLFDVVNLFVKADETRQMSVAPSPFKGKTTQNYIEVVA
jgi:hypothetical protein